MKRILLIRSGAIGDTLLLLPLVKYLERSYPEAEIGLAGMPERMLLLASQVHRSRVCDFDADLSWLFVSGVQGPEQQCEYLRSQDWILFFTSRPGGTADTNLKEIGCSRVDSIAALPPPSYPKHVVQYLFDALRIEGEMKLVIQSPPAWQVSGLWRFDRPGFTLDMCSFLERGLLAVCPGAGSPQKRWPVECYETLLKELSQWKPPQPILLILGPAERREDYKPLVRNHRRGDIVVVHSPALPELASMLRYCSAYIGNDSGITHLAALMGLQVLALFGPTNPRQWGPIGPHASVFYGTTLFRYPQWLVGAPDFLSGEKDLQALSPAAVLEWLETDFPDPSVLS